MAYNSDDDPNQTMNIDPTTGLPRSNQPTAPPPATPPPSAAGATPPPPPGADTGLSLGGPPPNDAGALIDSLYKKYGISDAGSGGGFADRAYWLAHPSEVLNGRLGRDLAGTGSDQPTGTPGTGPWQSSGIGQPEDTRGGGGRSTPSQLPPNFTLPSPTQGYGPSMNTPNSFWNGRSPMDFSNAAQGVNGGSSGSGQSDLLKQLMSRITLNQNGMGFKG